MNSLPKETRSVCPKCLQVVSAEIFEEQEKVYMKKACEDHGHFKALIWSDSKAYTRAERFSTTSKSEMRDDEDGEDCPNSCGLCSSHLQQTCLAVVEVTDNCDLQCDTCFASSNGGDGFQPDHESLSEAMKGVLRSEGEPRPLQLSGGEPLTRKDLPEIVEIARDLGFKHVEINTNGLAIARDLNVARDLVKSGVSAVYLQFDGLDDDVYLKLRGARLLELKKKAIENCEKFDLAVILVPTIVKDVNEDHLGDIIRFASAKKNVVGIHFQPVAYVGRYPSSFEDVRNRVTIPDLIRGIEGQTSGELRTEDFYPVPCPDPHCSALTLAIAEEGRLLPLSRLLDVDAILSRFEDSARVVPRAVERLWSLSARMVNWQTVGRILDNSRINPSVNEGFGKILSISMMAFQDCWTLDLERLRRCCVHVASANGCLTPFCAYYLTSIDGKRLSKTNKNRLR